MQHIVSITLPPGLRRKLLRELKEHELPDGVTINSEVSRAWAVFGLESYQSIALNIATGVASAVALELLKYVWQRIRALAGTPEAEGEKVIISTPSVRVEIELAKMPEELPEELPGGAW